MHKKRTYVEVDVDLDLDEFSTQELVEELQRRQVLTDDFAEFNYQELTESLELIYQKRRNGLAYDAEIDQLIYQILGRII